MNLRSSSPSQDVLSRGKFDFSIIDRAMSDMNMSLRKEEMREKGLKRKLHQGH